TDAHHPADGHLVEAGRALAAAGAGRLALRLGREEPWLPQPAGWADYAADVQAEAPGSMLALYRAAIRLRAAFGDGPLTWLPAPGGVLAFTRARGASCVVNLAAAPAGLPAHSELLLSSGPLDDAGRLPQDTAVWLRA
ncbi:hypothetical protein ACLMMR_37390, partial [Streptomyces sp. NPDC000405]